MDISNVSVRNIKSRETVTTRRLPEVVKNERWGWKFRIKFTVYRGGTLLKKVRKSKLISEIETLK